MLWVWYLLPCTPFVKFSVLSLQVQAGIKCSLPASFKGLSNLKLNISQKHMGNLPFSSLLNLFDSQEIYRTNVGPRIWLV